MCFALTVLTSANKCVVYEGKLQIDLAFDIEDFKKMLKVWMLLARKDEAKPHANES